MLPSFSLFLSPLVSSTLWHLRPVGSVRAREYVCILRAFSLALPFYHALAAPTSHFRRSRLARGHTKTSREETRLSLHANENWNRWTHFLNTFEFFFLFFPRPLSIPRFNLFADARWESEIGEGREEEGKWKLGEEFLPLSHPGTGLYRAWNECL